MRIDNWWRQLLLLAGGLALGALAAGCDSGNGGNNNGGGDDTVQVDQDTTGGTSNDVVPPEDDSVCVPACGTHVCGPDGCGGDCGACEPGMECQKGLCEEPPPDCDALCADVSCGMVETCDCGTCSDGLQCIAGTCKTPMDCDEQGFTGVVSQAKLDPHAAGGFYMHFQTLNKETTPFDVIVIEMETDAGGPTGPGVYDAAYNGFNEKGLWLYILTNWNGNGYEKLLVPTEGQIDITSLSDVGGQFTANLEGVRLVEATYNGDDNSVNPVAHGLSWCLDGVTLNVAITMTSPTCVEEGTGQLLGDNIANFQLQNCNGDWFSLHDLCGSTKALWFVATAGW